MPYATLRYEVDDGGVATIALDEPGTRNALSDQLLDELIAALGAARDDDDVRCVVLTSTHETVFSSGGNLAGFVESSPEQRHAANERFPRLFELIGRLGKPVLCAANGHVLAGALGLALACDLVIAKETASFGTPEINVGLFGFMIAALLARNVGRKKMTEMLLLGEPVDAHEAQRLGIVNRVTAPQEFDAAVADWAGKLAAKSPLLMRLGKDALYAQQDLAFAEALEYLRGELATALSTDDAREGVTAFLQKREPRWTGR